MSSTRSTRSSCKLPADGSGLFKAPLAKVIEEKCEGCGKAFKQLRKHLRFCKNILSRTVESQINSQSENEGGAALTDSSVKE